MDKLTNSSDALEGQLISNTLKDMHYASSEDVSDCSYESGKSDGSSEQTEEDWEDQGEDVRISDVIA